MALIETKTRHRPPNYSHFSGRTQTSKINACVALKAVLNKPETSQYGLVVYSFLSSGAPAQPLSVHRLAKRRSQMSSDFTHRMKTLMWLSMLNADQRLIQMSVTFELLTFSGNTAGQTPFRLA